MPDICLDAGIGIIAKEKIKVSKFMVSGFQGFRISGFQGSWTQARRTE
jgi:hypothetical protein